MTASFCLKPDAFQREFERFLMVLDLETESPNRFIDFQSGLIHESEGYKSVLQREGRRRLKVESWSEEMIGRGRITANIIAAIEIDDIIDGSRLPNNLVRWEGRYGEKSKSHGRLLALADTKQVHEIEEIFFRLFNGLISEGHAFDSLVNKVGRRYDLLAYIYFLLDSKRFMPIAPSHLERSFEALGIAFALSGQCSWDNYLAYNARLDAVQQFLSRSISGSVPTLLDAHSFCYILGKTVPGALDEGVEVLGKQALGLHREIRGLQAPTDCREYPNGGAREEFRLGWLDSTPSGLKLSDNSSEGLTWRSLGYDLGRTRSDLVGNEMDEIFAVARKVYLAQRFHRELLGWLVSVRRETGLGCSREANRLNAVGGLGVARRYLVASRRPPKVLEDLVRLGRVDLAMENLVVQRRYRDLFTPEEHSIARFRLDQFSWNRAPAEESLDRGEAVEIADGRDYHEGELREVLARTRKRSAKAREACLEFYGAICQVCELDFGERYGEIGEGFMHVHHLRPIYLQPASYQVDPIHDLRPVCPNCHAMLHREYPPLEIDALRARMKRIA